MFEKDSNHHLTSKQLRFKLKHCLIFNGKMLNNLVPHCVRTYLKNLVVRRISIKLPPYLRHRLIKSQFYFLEIVRTFNLRVVKHMRITVWFSKPNLSFV